MEDTTVRAALTPSIYVTAELLRYAHPAAVQRVGFREFVIVGERYRLLHRAPYARDTFVAALLPPK